MSEKQENATSTKADREKEQRIRNAKAKSDLRALENFLASFKGKQNFPFQTAQMIGKLAMIVQKSYISTRDISVITWADDEAGIKNLLFSTKKLKNKKQDLLANPTDDNIDKYKKIIDFEKKIAEITGEALELIK